MATARDVRAIAMALPGVTGAEGQLAFSVEVKGKQKGFAWSWKERVHPKKARVPNEGVLAVRVRDQADKAMLLAADEEKFFTEPHYNGFPAVLVRLRAVTKAELRVLLAEAWRCLASPALLEGATPARPPRKRAATARSRGGRVPSARPSPSGASRPSRRPSRRAGS